MAIDPSELELLADEESVIKQLESFASGIVSVFSRRSPQAAGPNEDAALLIPIDEKRGVIAIADGLGGAPRGEVAARIALESLWDSIKSANRASEQLREAVLSGFELANQRVRELGSGAGTTLIVVEISGSTIRPYHVGDSQLVILGQRGKIKLQTISHSPVGYALEAGFLDEKEALHHEERHVISNVIGASDMRIEVGAPIDLSARDTVVIGTDGLFDNLELDEICEGFRSGNMLNCSESALELCRKRMTDPTSGKPSKPDDVTVAVFRLRSGDDE